MMKIKHLLVFFLIGHFLTGCHENSAPGAVLTGEKGIKHQSLTSIQWIDSTLDLGKIKMGDTIVMRFRFANTGNLPLIIENAETSCSCTRIAEIPAAVPPGGKGEIVAIFDTRKSIVGFIRKGILVTGNTLPNKRQLRYMAEITGHKLTTGSN